MKKSYFFLLFGLITAQASAQISLNYLDAPGTGFFSEEARTPVAGNMGTTLGEQRRIAMERAVEIWQSHLNPKAPVVIDVSFESLPCNALGAAIAGASTISAFQNFPGAPLSDTFYGSALANHLAEEDLDPDRSEIRVRINAEIDAGNCVAVASMYYGIDSPPPTPGIPFFFRTMLHEIAHGLGFSALIDNDSGDFFFDNPDVFTRNMTYLPTGESWADLTSAERLGAAAAGPLTVWGGRNTQIGSQSQINNGDNLATITRTSDGMVFPAETATFGPRVPAGGITAEIVLVDDGVAPNSDGCEEIINAADVSGKIALIDRGGCDFSTKSFRAEIAGAVAVVIANTNPQQIIELGGTDPGLSIPTLAITLANGQTFRSLANGETLTLLPPGDRPGTFQGRPFLQTPFAFAPGSSISHFDGLTSTGILMRPDSLNIFPADTSSLDVTLTVMRDLGWDVQNIPYPNLDYALWAQLNQASPNGPEDDGDLDGHTNLEEYAFGGDPNDVTSFPAPPVIGLNAGNQVTFDYPLSNQAVDLSFRLLRLDTLPDPNPEVIPAGTLLDGSGEINLMRSNLGDLDTLTPQAFFRVEATRQ